MKLLLGRDCPHMKSNKIVVLLARDYGRWINWFILGNAKILLRNGAFINAHDRAVSRDGKTKYRLLDKEEDLEGREFSEAIMLDEHPDATDKEKERHKRIFRELYKTHR